MTDPPEGSAPLAGEVALVTGGGWNLGRGLARGFARAGAKVAVAARGRERIEEAARELSELGVESLAVPMDATDWRQVDAGVRAVEEAMGTVSVLAAFAGGGVGLGQIDEADPDQWWKVVERNLRTAQLCARAVLPGMRAAGRGSILFCAGGGAFFPNADVASTAYACAKAAVCRLTDQLAVDLLGTGIRVNCIEPGNVGSPESRTANPGDHRTPEEAAEIAVWLASTASHPVTGRIVAVHDTWWRDPERVRQVSGSYHDYCLRRFEP